MKYQKTLDLDNQQLNQDYINVPVRNITPTPEQTNGWTTYKSPDNAYSFQYPSSNWLLSTSPQYFNPTSRAIDGYSARVHCELCNSAGVINLFIVNPVAITSVDQFISTSLKPTDSGVVEVSDSERVYI